MKTEEIARLVEEYIKPFKHQLRLGEDDTLRDDLTKFANLILSKVNPPQSENKEVMSLEDVALAHGLCSCDEAYKSRNMYAPDCPYHSFAVSEAMEAYASKYKYRVQEFEHNDKWIPIANNSLPPFLKPLLFRGVIGWKSNDNVSYFSDELTTEEETLEYGNVGYILKNNSDYLLTTYHSPEELCDTYVTHYKEINFNEENT
jgi:hypothetical protein